jgi:hypothetical protein
VRSLADLQGDFAAALTDPALLPPAGLRAPALRRFAVYRNNRMAGLAENLEAAFPAVRRLVGEAFFAATASAYVTQQPPRSPVLLLYGESFGDFLDGFPPAAGVPYLGDVARLEWARRFACHAADAIPLPVASLAEVPEAALPALRFTLHPSLRLVTSRWPVASLWAATAEVDMARGEDVAVLRPELTVEVRVLPPSGLTFIAALAGGATLGVAAEVALAAAPDGDLAAHLHGLFALGAVTALHILDPQRN